jgi:hypothetical protein
MPNIDSVSCGYLVISLVISIYQGVRGFVFQYYNSKTYELYKSWGKPARIFMFCVTDFVFYFVTTIVGFASLLIAKNIISSTPKLQDLGTGAAALVIFLLLIGILGICGQLPYLIQSGKLPWQK